MKHGGDYARHLKQLFHQLIRKHGKPVTPEPTDPLEQMIIAILGGNTSHHKALVAFRKLREQMVDLNELRVTPVTELARTIGSAIPHAEMKAQRIVEVLNDIRRRHDTLDLSFLKQRGRREAREYLESLEGVDRATAASVTLFSLGGHAIPVDDLTLQVLRKEEIVDPAADAAAVQSFLEHHISASDSMTFSLLLDRHVASRGVKLPDNLVEESTERVVPAPARPETKPTVEEPVPNSSRDAVSAPEGREGKTRPVAGAADAPHGRTSAPRSSPSADHHRKPPPGASAAKPGKTTKRR
jgi:endonuclease III